MVQDWRVELSEAYIYGWVCIDHEKCGLVSMFHDFICWTSWSICVMIELIELVSTE